MIFFTSVTVALSVSFNHKSPVHEWKDSKPRAHVHISNVPFSGVSWCGADDLGEEFLMRIHEDEVVDQIREQVGGVVEGEFSTVSAPPWV